MSLSLGRSTSRLRWSLDFSQNLIFIYHLFEEGEICGVLGPTLATGWAHIQGSVEMSDGACCPRDIFQHGANLVSHNFYLGSIWSLSDQALSLHQVTRSLHKGGDSLKLQAQVG